jgi:hypothetical protein
MNRPPLSDLSDLSAIGAGKNYPSRPRPEEAIQRGVLQHLEVRAAPDVFWFHPANGGYRTPIEAKVLKSLGVTAGVHDLILIRDGKTYGLELKAVGDVRYLQSPVATDPIKTNRT